MDQIIYLNKYKMWTGWIRYILACAPISLYNGQLPLDTCMYNNTDVCIINITRLLFSAR